MEYIVLPGFSLENKTWAYELKTKMANYGYAIKVFEWQHWKSGNPADFSHHREAKRLKLLIPEIEPYTIIAKSIGTLVACTGIVEENFTADRYIFFGIPLHDVSNPFERKIFHQAAPQLIDLSVVQNENDPHGSYRDTKRFLIENKISAKLVKTPGSDHNYPFYGLLNNILMNREIVDYPLETILA